MSITINGEDTLIALTTAPGVLSDIATNDTNTAAITAAPEDVLTYA